MTGVFGGAVMACSAIACLATADVPMAAAACASFGLLGAAGAWTRFREMRLRRALLPPDPLPQRLPVSAPWTTEELAVLREHDGDEDRLYRLLKGTPQKWRERKFR